jgi:hypothetical protein
VSAAVLPSSQIDPVKVGRTIGSAGSELPHPADDYV